MAFEPKQNEIKKALQEQTKGMTETTSIEVPTFDESMQEERTKTYTFTLQPSIRKKLDIIAKEHNYKSSSKFLNELIKKM